MPAEQQPKARLRSKTKVCTRCGVRRPRIDFSAHSKASDGLQSNCKKCFRERARARRTGRPCVTCGKPKEVGIPRGAKLCLECAKTCSECKSRPRTPRARTCKECRARRDKIRNATPTRKRSERITRIATKYQVSREEAERLMQVKTCQACGRCKDEIGAVRGLHVDHCHETGRVRGVLCFNCNAALGHLSDDLSRIDRLRSYLRKHKRT